MGWNAYLSIASGFGFALVPPRSEAVNFGRIHCQMSEHYGDGCPGSTVFVKVTGLEEYHKELTAKNYKYLRPGIEDAPWKGEVRERHRPVRQSDSVQRVFAVTLWSR
jgi:Glyoxalase superfamily protein